MRQSLKKSLKKNQPKYKSHAWSQYDSSTLAHAVGFFVQRATHRSDIVKAQKDINDARAYLDMLEHKLLE